MTDGYKFDSTIKDGYNPMTGDVDGVSDSAIEQDIEKSQISVDFKIEQLRLSINQSLNDLSDRLLILETNYTLLDQRITTNEERILAIDTDITGINAILTDLNNRATIIENTINAAYTGLVVADGKSFDIQNGLIINVT